MHTTLNKIREHDPCREGWEKLLAYLGKTKADDEPLSILTILDSNGLDDALWALGAVDGHDRELRLFAVWCARRVQHRMTDQRSLAALDVAEQYANGLATDEQLAAARDAAWDAARAAAVTWAAVWAAAEAAAWAAAWDAAEAVRAAEAATATAEAAEAWEAESEAKEAALRRICEELEGKSDE